MQTIRRAPWSAQTLDTMDRRDGFMDPPRLGIERPIPTGI
jgi:hypothetical protein